MSACTIHATVAELPRASHEAQRSHVHLVLHVEGCTRGVVASVLYQGLAHDVFARADAARLRRGDQLTVYCAGFGPDAGGCMRLFGVDHVVLHESRRSTAMPLAARPTEPLQA
jgi:hypothetical protein